MPQKPKNAQAKMKRLTIASPECMSIYTKINKQPNDKWQSEQNNIQPNGKKSTTLSRRSGYPQTSYTINYTII
jgi:hypothetical protein